MLTKLPIAITEVSTIVPMTDVTLSKTDASQVATDIV